MPRGKKSVHAVSSSGELGVSPAPAGRSIGGVSSLYRLQEESNGESSTLLALQTIACYSEGWLRMVSHEEGLLTYWKFKFSRGKYAGSYVFYRCDDMDIRAAVWGLVRKIEAVYAGTLRPTPDTPYD